jgi:Cof subfamily protein (haloacid dehalogenase superfamily)
MYKLLVLDVDGTLLTSRHTITRKTMHTINMARKKGLQVTLATGRNYLNAQFIARKLKIALPIISNDGAYIINPRDQSVLFKKKIMEACVTGILEILNQYDLHYVLHHETLNITNRKFNWRRFAGRSKIETIFLKMYEVRSFKIIPSIKIIDYVTSNTLVPFKITVFSDSGSSRQLDTIVRIFTEEFAGIIDISNSGYKGFEILPYGMSKAKGLTILEKNLGFDKSEIIAIGDSFNDIEMIKHAGLGIAMGNAAKEIQNSAVFVTTSNDQNGIAYALEKFFL